MAPIRTFICFELPDKVRSELAELQNSLKPKSNSVRWSKPDSIHLTLNFLGDVEKERMDDIFDAVKRATEGNAPFQINISGTGAFPNYKRPTVYWIGVNESSGALHSIQQKIETELEKLGFPKEKRKFSPHLTIGRVKSQHGLNEISTALQDVKLPTMTFIADEIVVMQSVLQPGGARYTPLSVIKLKS